MTEYKPRGIDLLATLIDLLAEQEGVKITYEITKEKEDVLQKAT